MRWLLLPLVLASCAMFASLWSLTYGSDYIASAYNPSEWGGWEDEDGDCLDTRQEVLIAESRVDPVLEGCRVVSGEWLDPYTGRTFTDPGQLDIDHMVPLKEAHDSGAHLWTQEKKRSYFNDTYDPQHLIAVSASANRSKGHRGPTEWLPERAEYRCQYIKDWVTIKDRWALKIDSEAMVGLLIIYCGDRL